MTVGTSIGLGIVPVAAFSFARWAVLRRCTSCRPRCPNGHRFEIEGMLLLGWMWIALAVGLVAGSVLP